MVDAESQTNPSLPAAVVGIEKDLLLGVRVRKSFGTRSFWGIIVGCYWISGGLFYKVSFDDGDVDILSIEEILQDVQAAKDYAKENPQYKHNPNVPLEEYLNFMRQHNLKRKHDDVFDITRPNIRRVSLWGQRLYASIYTNEKNETFIKELLKTEDGQAGEMEATGCVQVGDMILAVNKTKALGMSSGELAELIRRPKRPIILTFYRPQQVKPTGGATNQPSVGMQASVLGYQGTLTHSAPMANQLAHQWTHAPNLVSNKEIVRQRLTQNVAARQGHYVPGYPMGVIVPPRSTTQGIQSTRPMYQTSQPLRQHAYNFQHNKQADLAFYEQAQQLRAQSSSSRNQFTLPVQDNNVTIRSHGDMAISSKPLSNQPEESPSQMSTGSTTFTTDSRRLTTHDVESIARLAEKDPEAAQRLMNSEAFATSTSTISRVQSSLSQSTETTSFRSSTVVPDNVPVPADDKTRSSSLASMSFLSPTDFNVETSAASHHSTTSPGKTNLSPSLVAVQIFRQRLYLTLGLQGSLIAVTSFARDEAGGPGEVELSQKVFIGDILVRMGDNVIKPGMTPNYVAKLVTNAPRPITLWFERASWDILNGKA